MTKSKSIALLAGLLVFLLGLNAGYLICEHPYSPVDISIDVLLGLSFVAGIIAAVKHMGGVAAGVFP